MRAVTTPRHGRGHGRKVTAVATRGTRKSALAIFTSISNPVRAVSRNMETFLNLLDDTHSGKKRWGIVFTE